MRTGVFILCLLAGTFYNSAAQVGEEPGSLTAKSQQVSLDSLFKIVEEYNPRLRTAASSLESSRLRSGTGLTPSDPEVEFGYLAGFPSSVGNRIDFRVSQEFEFPTVYMHKAKAKDIEIEEAEQVYALTRQEVLLKAIQLWIERIYLNELEAMLEERLKSSEQLLAQYKKLAESGESSQLALSQVNLQAVVLRGEREELRGDIKVNSEALSEVSGGKIYDSGEKVFPEIIVPELDILLKAYENDPRMKYYSSEVRLMEVGKQLAISQSLPTFTAGYYSETVIDQRFRGVAVGLSIPLWENTRKVKLAKAEIIHAGDRMEEYKSRQQTELSQKQARRETLKRQLNDLRQAVLMINDEALLGVALDLGEISLSEYFYNSELYFQNMRKLLQYQKDLLMLEADLLKVLY